MPPLPSAWKSGFIRGMAFPEGGNLVVFYYVSVSEIWPNKSGHIWWEEPYKRGTTVVFINAIKKKHVINKRTKQYLENTETMVALSGYFFFDLDLDLDLCFGSVSSGSAYLASMSAKKLSICCFLDCCLDCINACNEPSPSASPNILACSSASTASAPAWNTNILNKLYYKNKWGVDTEAIYRKHYKEKV